LNRGLAWNVARPGPSPTPLRLVAASSPDVVVVGEPAGVAQPTATVRNPIGREQSGSLRISDEDRRDTVRCA
jgi:hypothetical protein